jgi:hypothetical protein
MYQPQPSPEAIKAFKETTIRNFSVGHNHVVALDSEKQAWSWGEPPDTFRLQALPCLISNSSRIRMSGYLEGEGGHGLVQERVVNDAATPDCKLDAVEKDSNDAWRFFFPTLGTEEGPTFSRGRSCCRSISSAEVSLSAIDGDWVIIV